MAKPNPAFVLKKAKYLGATYPSVAKLQTFIDQARRTSANIDFPDVLSARPRQMDSKLISWQKIFVLSALLLLTTCSFASEPCSPDPVLQGASSALGDTTCKALSTIFSNYSTSCSLAFPLNLVKRKELTKPNPATTSASAIPANLLVPIEHLALANATLVPHNIGLARLLSQVFSSPSLSSLNKNDYIGATASAQPATLTQIGIDATSYATTCQATIAANVDAKADFTFAPATVKSSLDTSLNANSQSGLLMSIGSFDSPLLIFSRGASPLYADLLMLGWRVRTNNSNGTLYYLSTARGLASSQMSSSQLYAKIAGEVDLSAGFFSVSSTANLSMARNVTDQLTESLFDTVVETPNSNDFVAIPTVDQLKSSISNLQMTGITANPPSLLHTGDHSVIAQDVVGIPQDMCDGQNTTWSVADFDPSNHKWSVQAGSLRTVSSLLPGNQQNVPVCKVSFNLVNATTAASDFDVAPAMTGNFGGTAFTLKLGSLHFTASEYPHFGSRVLYNQAGVQKQINIPQGGTIPVLEYAVPISVVQSQSSNGYNSALWATNPKATCVNNLVIDLAPATLSQMQIVPPTGTVTLWAPLDYSLDSAGGTLDFSDPNPTQCTITSGQIEFSDTSGTLSIPVTLDITKDLNLGIKLPRVKPTLSLSSNPPSGNSFVFSITTQGVNDPTILNGASASLMEGTTILASVPMSSGLSASFPAVTLDPAVPHNIVVVLPASATIVGATSQVQIPKRQ